MLRAEFRERGIAALQCYGTADLGLIAYESWGPDGAVCDGMVLDEGIIVEIVHPGTGEPTAPGEVGEVVVTTLTPEYPLIRFATGDLSAQLAGTSPCGRTNHRIRGWLGRADQSVKVRGLFVHPVQIAEIMRRHKSIIRGAARRRAAAERRRDDTARRDRRTGGTGERDCGNVAGRYKAARHGSARIRREVCRMTARSSRTGARSAEFSVILHHQTAAICPNGRPDQGPSCAA